MVSKDGAFLGKPKEGGRRKINMTGIHPRRMHNSEEMLF